MRRITTLIALFLFATLLLTACQPDSDAAAGALADYLDALVSKDEARLVQLACLDWETQALLELDAFQSVETSLEGLDCQPVESQEGRALVVCQGQILASYSGEVQAFDLSERSYSLVQEDGDWRVCGY